MKINKFLKVETKLICLFKDLFNSYTNIIIYCPMKKRLTFIETRWISWLSAVKYWSEHFESISKEILSNDFV